MSRSLITVAAASSVLAVTGGYAHADSESHSTTSNSPGVVAGNSVAAPVDVSVNLCGNSVDGAAMLNPAFGNNCANESAQAHDHRGGSSGTDDNRGGGHADSHAGDQYGGQHGDQYGEQYWEHYGDQGGDEYGDQRGTRHGGHDSTADSPGVASGNNARVPVEAPVNLCGNSADVVALLNPAFGNNCASEETGGNERTSPPGNGWTPPPVVNHPPGKAGWQTPPAHQTPPLSSGHHTPPPLAEHHIPPPRAEHHAAPGPVVPVHQELRRAQLAHTGAEDLGTAGAVSAGLLLSGAMLYRRSRALRA
ncbi:chaplin [Streptomyces sp. PH10-H1]|uniref:chaplin n=1 Tax=Streptomyces sp. PH10-H1 TaxID=3046212 RepID=UPI0032D8E7F7